MLPRHCLRAALPGIIIALSVIIWSLAWLLVPMGDTSAHAATFLPAARTASVRLAARPVALSDAHTAPTTLMYLYPHAYIADDQQCKRGAYWSDVSAYRWTGRALGAQRWNADHTLTFWRDRRGGRVTFDGVVFHNTTHHRVIVAGWCD